MIGFCCEAFIFAYLGLVFFFYLKRAWSFSLIAFELPVICISRFVGIFGLIFLMRFLCCKKPFLSMGELTFQWFAGLIRGPIAFGLVLRLDSEPDIVQPRKDIIITSTLVLVIFTTIVFGSIMPLLSKCLLTKHTHHSHPHSHEHHSGHNVGSRLLQPDLDTKPAMSLHQPFLHPNAERRTSFYVGGTKEVKGTCKYYWKKFDHGIMKPIFIHKFDEINQKKDLEFYEGFMKGGNEWANDYRRIGEIRHQTVHREHTAISVSSEDDSEEEGPDHLIAASSKMSPLSSNALPVRLDKRVSEAPAEEEESPRAALVNSQGTTEEEDNKQF